MYRIDDTMRVYRCKEDLNLNKKKDPCVGSSEVEEDEDLVYK